jgi:hypothetical protein
MKINNLVAKHALKYNKATVQKDRKNDYKRKTKHNKKKDYFDSPFSLSF